MASKLDPIIILLTGLLCVLIIALFAAEVFFKEDTQFFQVVSNMASGVMGALLGLITGKGQAQNAQHSVTPPPVPPPPPPTIPPAVS